MKFTGVPVNQVFNLEIDYTDLKDIDDTMDLDLALMGLVGAELPELLRRDYNIRTLDGAKFAVIKDEDVEGAEWNATHNQN